MRTLLALLLIAQYASAWNVCDDPLWSEYAKYLGGSDCYIFADEEGYSKWLLSDEAKALREAGGLPWQLSSTCPAQWSQCVNHAYYDAQAAYNGCVASLNYALGYTFRDEKIPNMQGLTAQDTLSGWFTSEADCKAKLAACYQWTAHVDGLANACMDTLEQVR